MTLHSIPSGVFRAYDLRGQVGHELNEAAFYQLGLALACFMHEFQRTKAYVARDGRLTSPSFALALKQGLLDSGVDVIDLGAVPTPVLYYATHQYGIDCGFMVTGSHNPADYNGLKMVLAGDTLAQEQIRKLYDLVCQNQRLHGQGQEASNDISGQYQQEIVQNIHLKRPFKVVVDCGNGIGGPMVVQTLEQIGCEVIRLYCDVDGNFPNHHPDPSVEANLVDLKAAVIHHQADLGFAFDGDADRLGVVTNTGRVIWPDRLMMLYSQDILKRHPKATIVFDVKCSLHLAQVIEHAGGIAKMCPTGHSLVKALMKREQAVLAGEMSGHLFFKDRWYGFDDALYSACRLLEILSAQNLTSEEQFQRIPNSVNTPELKIHIPDTKKFEFMRQFSEKAQFEKAKLITIDGLRVEFAEGWGLLRASNTTPCLVARFEAIDHNHLENIKSLFKQQINQLDSALVVPF